MTTILAPRAVRKVRTALAEDESADPKILLGVRVSALLETAAFLAVALAIDGLLGAGNRFADISPHPFWIVVLLASSYYGVREGLAAAALASAALLFGHMPELRVDEDIYAWLLRATLLPLGWCIGALVLGQMQTAFRRRLHALRQELDESREYARIVSDAYERLQLVKEHYESRVAGQLCTVSAMYNAWLAIEKHGVGDVLLGVSALVRTVMNPDKYSLYLLNGPRLEAAVQEGWLPGDQFLRQIDASLPLFHAVVADRRFLTIADPADEPLLRDFGVLAGPVVNSDSGEFIGMLKIEAIGFLDLNPSNIQNFRILCAWIGAAVANAERVEKLQQRLSPHLPESPQPAGCDCGSAKSCRMLGWLLPKP